MIYDVVVTNHVGETITLELAGPEKSGLAITSIDGLSPTNADVNITSMANTDLSIFNSSKLKDRNIVFNFILWNYPIEDSRLTLYRFFPIKKKISMVFRTDSRLAYCEGYVEKVECDIFSEQETAQVSIICPDPFMYEYDEKNGYHSDTFYGSAPRLYFESNDDPNATMLANESLNEPLIEFGSLDFEEKKLINLGDADIGLTITLHCVGPVVNPTFHNLSMEDSMSILSDKIIAITGENLKMGDDLVICTERGKKSVNLYRDGVKYPVISSLASYSNWITAKQGMSRLAFTADSGYDNMQVTYTYRIAYEGI